MTAVASLVTVAGPPAAQLPSLLASVAPAWAPGRPLPPETTWFSYNPLSPESTQNESERAAAGDVYVVPIPEACPPGTTDYPVARFNCITTYREDGNRGPDPTIGLRRGDPDIEPGFGARRCRTVGDRGDRPAGTVGRADRPDRFNLGVVTAYCKGFDGQCPAGVNESVAPGQP